jgi:predicted RNase H-like nuclease (RuvC/YqgF family)
MWATAVDAPTAGVIIVAIIGGFVTLAARMAPKTRSEAGVDRSQARKNDAEAWSSLVDRLEKTIERQDKKIDELETKSDEMENAMAEERRECDRKIALLQDELQEIHGKLPEKRIWFFDDDPPPAKT